MSMHLYAFHRRRSHIFRRGMSPLTFESRRGTGGTGLEHGTNAVMAKYTLSAPDNNRTASGAVLATSL